MIPTPPWSLVYADGSANVYTFEASADGVDVVYEPVTPERSSTGTYSGGEPFHARLDGDDPRLQSLWRLVVGLEADPSRHAAERCKGDGAFTITDGGGTRRFLVERGALDALESLLVDELRGAA
jgi:hypothetical protein